MKNFTSVRDVTDINLLVQNALNYKATPLSDKELGAGKRVGMIFLNPSLRTRLSTQIAARNLGLHDIVLNMDKDGWKLELEDGVVMNGNTVEHIKDAAPVLGAYFDILCVRSFPTLVNRDEDYSEIFISQLKKYSGVPVVSLESSTLHPLQSLTDLLTITETFKQNRKPRIVLSWAPHIKPLPHCVANSFAQWINAWGGADFVVTHPEGYNLNPAYTDGAEICYNQALALQGADYVYVKNWSSYNDYGKVLDVSEPWMLTNASLQATNNARVMHCLPVRRNVELSDEVLDSPASLVTQQASNRVWAAQAVLSEILKNEAN